MAWLDFIKQIRRDEEDEQNRGQGVKNSVFGFLDDILDTGERRVKRMGKAFTPDVDEEGYGLENRFQDIVGGLTPEPIKDAAGIVAGAGREIVVKPLVKAGMTLREGQTDQDTINKTYDEALSYSEEERNRLADEAEARIKRGESADGPGVSFYLSRREHGDISDAGLEARRQKALEDDLNADKPFTPDSTVEKALLGNEDIHSAFTGDYRVARKRIKEWGGDDKVASAGAVPFAVGMAALDLPGGKQVKMGGKALKEIGEEGVELLMKSDTPEEIMQQLTKSKSIQDYGEDVFREASERISKLTDKKQISKAIDDVFGKAKKIGKAADQPGVVNMSGESLFRGGELTRTDYDDRGAGYFFSTTPETASTWGDNVQTYTADNLRLLDIDTPEGKKVYDSVRSKYDANPVGDKTTEVAEGVSKDLRNMGFDGYRGQKSGDPGVEINLFDTNKITPQTATPSTPANVIDDYNTTTLGRAGKITQPTEPGWKAKVGPGKTAFIDENGQQYTKNYADLTPQEKLIDERGMAQNTLDATTKQKERLLASGAKEGNKAIQELNDTILNATKQLADIDAKLGDEVVEAVPSGPAREISDFATSLSHDYRTPDELVDDMADMRYEMDKSLKGGINVRRPSADGYGQDDMFRTSEHTKFFRDFYAANGKAPTKADYRAAVKTQLENGQGSLLEDDIVDAYGLIKTRQGDNAALDQAAPPAQQFMDIVKKPITPPRDLEGGPGRTKLRRFLQTAKESEGITDESKAAIDDIDPQRYNVQAQEPVMEAARLRVEKDVDAAMRYVDDSEKWTDDKAATLIQLARKASQEGRTDDFVEFLVKIDEQGREAGRANAILNAIKLMSPEGIVRFGQRQVDNIGGGGQLKKNVERVKEAVEKASKVKRKDVEKSIDDVLKQMDEVGDEASEKSVGEKVAKNIETYMSPQKKKQVDTLVAELTKKIKQEMIAPRPGAPKRTAMDVLKEVYKRGDEAMDAWPESKAILREKFNDNPDVLKQLDDFFESTLGSPAASRTLDAAIRETMQKNKLRIAEIIQKSWDAQITDISKIASSLVEGGFKPDDARIIAEEVGSRVKSQVEAAKLKQLQRFAKEAPKKVRPALEDKITKFSNLGAMNDADYADLVRTKLDLPTLDNKTIEEISGLAQKMQGLEDGPDKNKVLGDIIQKIADTMPVTKREKFNAYRYQNLLSSPRTQLRNIAANTFNTLITRPATLFTGAAGDVVASAVTRQPRERYFKELPNYYKGLVKGFFDSHEAMAAAWKGTADITNPDFVDQFGKGAVQAARMRNLPKKWTVVSRLMEAQDRMFSGMIAGGEYAALIKRGVPEEQAVKQAHEMAEYSLLRQALDPRNATGQGAMLSGIDAASAALTDVANKMPLGRWMVPFIRTPLNFGKQWLEFSPVGLVNATAGESLARRMGKEAMTDERRIEALNKGMLGSAITGLGVTLAADDKLTWAVPETERERDLFYAEGKKPYSVKIGDKWIPLINFGPFGYALGLPAAFKHNFSETPDSMNDNVAEKTYKSIASMGQLFSQQTFLQGVNNLFSLVSGDKDMNMEKFAAGLAGQTIPLNSLQRFAASVIDPTYREAEGFVDYLKRDTPFLSKELEGQTNVITQEPTTRNWSDYLAPYSIGQERDNPEEQRSLEINSDFYRTMARASNGRDKISEQITEAIAAKDYDKARQLQKDYNDRFRAEALKVKDKYGEVLANDPELRKRFNAEYKKRRLNRLTTTSKKGVLRRANEREDLAESVLGR